MKTCLMSGKVAVVTGGSRGIGAMIARGLVENGVKTYITARKLDELEGHGGGVVDRGRLHRTVRPTWAV